MLTLNSPSLVVVEGPVFRPGYKGCVLAGWVVKPTLPQVGLAWLVVGMSKQLRATNKKTGLSICHQAVVDAVRGRGINGRAIIGYRHELKNPMIESKITHLLKN
jgi:hypothetical protein